MFILSKTLSAQGLPLNYETAFLTVSGNAFHDSAKNRIYDLADGIVDFVEPLVD